MQSLIASSVDASLSMLASICTAAHDEEIGASASERAIKIARMMRKRCRARGPFGR